MKYGSMPRLKIDHFGIDFVVPDPIAAAGEGRDRADSHAEDAKMNAVRASRR